MKYWLIGGILGLILGGTLFALNCWDLVFVGCKSNPHGALGIEPSCGNSFACIEQAIYITFFAVVIGVITGLVIEKIKHKK